MENIKEFVVRNCGKEIVRLTWEEFVFLIDCSINSVSSTEDREIKFPGSAKKGTLAILRLIYEQDIYRDENIDRLCAIAKGLYEKLFDISSEDIFYMVKQIVESKEFLELFGVASSFWEENQISIINNKSLKVPISSALCLLSLDLCFK